MGLSEEELDTQCDELFSTIPIKFVPREESDEDQAIFWLIQELELRIPILHIKDKLYLIGSSRISCEIKRDIVMLRIGGGYEKFVEYVPRNQKFFERSLVVYMIKSGQSLEWVVDALFNGKKIKNVVKQKNESASRSRSKTPVDANRSYDVKKYVQLNISQNDPNQTARPSPPRERISFRDTSPYSKKTSSPLNIKRV